MEYWEVALFFVGLVGVSFFLIIGTYSIAAALSEAPLSNKWKKEFNKKIEERLQEGTLKNQSEIEQLYDTFLIEKNKNSFFSIKIGMEEMLNNFLLNAKGLNEENRSLINSFIKNKREIILFEGIPNEERDYLFKINSHLIENESQNCYAIANLKLLGDQLAKRHRYYKKNFRVGIWSLIFGILGVAATVLTYYLGK